MMAISFYVNGKHHTVKVKAASRVADLLRDELLLTGTKVGCGIGRCGACSILVDGQLANACLLMAYQIDGKHITTIEGLGGESLHMIQQAFLQEGGFQCGYCTSGMIMAVKALTDKVPCPDESDIKEALAGNLCRCTGYGGIVRAVKCLSHIRKEEE
nr:(2Fe-2S)-binding protein [Bacillus massiliglaciei]